MDRKLLKQLRRALMLESFFSGASSLSKVFDETEVELEDMIKYIEEKVRSQRTLEGRFFKNGK